MTPAPDAHALTTAGLDTASEAGRERVRIAIENFGLAFFESDLRAGTVTLTPNAFPLFGLPVPASLTVDRAPFWQTYHPDDADWARATFEADLRGERGRDTYRETVRIIRATDRLVRRIEFSGRMFGPAGARTHIVGMLRDVTALVEAEERQALLLREVNHRANNTLAVVQSLVRLTRAETVPAYARALEGRVLSLARTQSLLLEADHGRTTIETVVDGELAAYRGAFALAIEAVPPLTTAAVQPVAMILHELATNAAKHGAFRQAGGLLRLGVRQEAEAVVLDWVEQAGGGVQPPARRGTGMGVMEAQVRSLGGRLGLDWQPDGLRATLSVPLRRWAGRFSAAAD